MIWSGLYWVGSVGSVLYLHRERWCMKDVTSLFDIVLVAFVIYFMSSQFLHPRSSASYIPVVLVHHEQIK